MIWESDYIKLQHDMKNELPSKIEKNQLIDWFLNKQERRRRYYAYATVKDLIRMAGTLNILIVREE